ncbi:alanyl-tRNA editing protein [Sulfitobacter guttiformis]|uniref:Alanine--tRNA ligase n=1 Tax=Sulfitobacter guttiformis TaxID=74349 RepID=A0A420DHP1_9RHOB|nr:alanyl-tRNA editing protein [Sulfitobacter guttiformis]KIN72507.1 Alanyl-transfer RNA synthetase domain protein [Sulfitobacter guttiformis KCTC 32187]RKE93746.1 Ala-tRNA(Pro) hydrolase [Sulfitobacter guttiformis]
MTIMLFRDDPYMREANGRVLAHTEEGGIILDASVFYPTGGGQPGDSGTLEWDAKRMVIATAVKGEGETIVLVPSEPVALPPIGCHIVQHLDWDRRHKHMRIHTALHLLSVAVPFAVSGGAISATHGRLDFNMPDAPEDREALEQSLNAFIERDARVSDGWITEAELDAAPELVKTMAVKPPRGTGDIRLVRIGEEDDWIDLQPCGGTHVARTGEIGALRLGKIEKKGKLNRRIYLHLDS